MNMNFMEFRHHSRCSTVSPPTLFDTIQWWLAIQNKAGIVWSPQHKMNIAHLPYSLAAQNVWSIQCTVHTHTRTHIVQCIHSIVFVDPWPTFIIGLPLGSLTHLWIICKNYGCQVIADKYMNTCTLNTYTSIMHACTYYAQYLVAWADEPFSWIEGIGKARSNGIGVSLWRVTAKTPETPIVCLIADKIQTGTIAH